MTTPQKLTATLSQQNGVITKAANEERDRDKIVATAVAAIRSAEAPDADAPTDRQSNFAEIFPNCLFRSSHYRLRHQFKSPSMSPSQQPW